MEEIKSGKFQQICRFDKDDFLCNNEKINNIMLAILSSHEAKDDNFNVQKAKDYVNELNLDIMTKDFLEVRLYVLWDKNENVPLSFALFSQDETRDDWHLEYISTHNDYHGMGYAESLFLYAAKDIANTEFPYISSVVNEDNYASLHLHEAISNYKGIKTFSSKMDYEDELYDAYDEEEYNGFDYYDTEESCSNRISFLFDVRELQKQDKLESVDDVVM